MSVCVLLGLRERVERCCIKKKFWFMREEGAGGAGYGYVLSLSLFLLGFFGFFRVRFLVLIEVISRF